MNNKEHRLLNVNLRSTEEENEKMILEGYAVVFDDPATHWGMTEIVDKHALDNCDMSDVCMKYNHDDTHTILARTRNKSLELKIDEKGLFIHAELIDTQANKDIYKMVKAGLLDKQSFAFTTTDEEWNENTQTRTILAIDKLYDVSVVDVPFYDGTNILARSLDTSKEYVDIKNKERRKKMANKLAKEELLKRL